MTDDPSPHEFRSQVQRLVAVGKLSSEDAEGLLEGLDAPVALDKVAPDPTAQAHAGAAAEAPPPDLQLELSAFTLQVIHDPALPRPQLHVNTDGHLALDATPHGWRVARVGSRMGNWANLRGVLTVPFTPRNVRAEVSGGSLTLPDLAGELHAEVSGGTLSVGAAAALRAEVNGGLLSAGDVSGPTRLEVNGGNITVAQAGTLNAEVNGGNLTWSGVLRTGQHRLEVNAGNATLHLLPGSSVHVAGEVTLGQVRADFPLQREGGFLESRVSGQLGGGAARLSCEVAAGQLKLVTR